MQFFFLSEESRENNTNHFRLSPFFAWHWQFCCSPKDWSALSTVLNFLLVNQQRKIFPSFLLSLQILQEKALNNLYNWQLQPLLQGRLRKTHILSNVTRKCLLIYLVAEAHTPLLLCDPIQRRDSCCIFNWYIKIAGCTRHRLTSMESLKSHDKSAECLCGSDGSSMCRYLSLIIFFFWQPSFLIVR